LKAEFKSWAGRNWKDTALQNRALEREAKRRGIPVPEAEAVKAWRKAGVHRWLVEREVVFSVKFPDYASWRESEARTSAYQRRIQRYMQRFPHATLAEARGHGKR
jgi:hypothetical protein